MPAWVTFVVGFAALLAALGLLWRYVLRAAELLTATRKMLPLLEDLAAQLSAPSTFSVLAEIVKEFRTDSGSSLRDVVNRLEVAAIENHELIVAMKGQVDAGAATGRRIEDDATRREAEA